MRFDEVDDSNQDSKISSDFKKYFKSGGEFVVKNGKLRVTGDANVSSIEFKNNRLPVTFLSVMGSMRIINCSLVTLEGSPTIVTGTFNASRNNLTNLIGGPKETVQYYVSNNPLESLDGLPLRTGKFSCSYSENLGLLRIFTIQELTKVVIFDTNEYLHETTAILQKILDNKSLNTQQKILSAKRELIKHGYEGNAKL